MRGGRISILPIYCVVPLYWYSRTERAATLPGMCEPGTRPGCARLARSTFGPASGAGPRPAADALVGFLRSCRMWKSRTGGSAPPSQLAPRNVQLATNPTGFAAALLPALQPVAVHELVSSGPCAIVMGEVPYRRTLHRSSSVAVTASIKTCCEGGSTLGLTSYQRVVTLVSNVYP